MKFNSPQNIVLSIFAVVILLGCNIMTPGQATPDVAGTAAAVLAGTKSAEANIALTVNAAVVATKMSEPTSPAQQMSTPVASSTTAINVDYYYTLSEEELAALIDQTVGKAILTAEQAMALTTQCTADQSVTSDEVTTVSVQVSAAGTAIDEVNAMIAAYSSVYGAYASQAVTELQQIEQDLAAINTNLSSISTIMEEGAEAATQAIEQLNTAAQTTSEKISSIQSSSKTWVDEVNQEIAAREKKAMDMQPNAIASDRQGTLDSVKHYTTSLRSSFEDKMISLDELLNISQLGANASASLKKNGGAQLSQFATQIDGLTRQVARGQLPQARQGLDGFERSFPRR